MKNHLYHQNELALSPPVLTLVNWNINKGKWVKDQYYLQEFTYLGIAKK